MDSSDRPTGTRKWRAKFDDAFRGLKLGVRGHSSFSVHFFMAALVIMMAVVLNIPLAHWCILIGCITAVLGAELFNSAIEIMCRVIDIEKYPEGKQPLDIAAGAVLMVSIGAAVTGGLILGHHLLQLSN